MAATSRPVIADGSNPHCGQGRSSTHVQSFSSGTGVTGTALPGSGRLGDALTSEHGRALPSSSASPFRFHMTGFGSRIEPTKPMPATSRRTRLIDRRRSSNSFPSSFTHRKVVGCRRERSRPASRGLFRPERRGPLTGRGALVGADRLRRVGRARPGLPPAHRRPAGTGGARDPASAPADRDRVSYWTDAPARPTSGRSRLAGAAGDPDDGQRVEVERSGRCLRRDDPGRRHAGRTCGGCRPRGHPGTRAAGGRPARHARRSRPACTTSTSWSRWTVRSRARRPWPRCGSPWTPGSGGPARRNGTTRPGPGWPPVEPVSMRSRWRYWATTRARLPLIH